MPGIIALLDSHGTLGGAQRALVDLARGLHARGWTVLALLGAEGPLTAALQRWEVAVTITALTPWSIAGAWQAGTTLARRLRAAGATAVLANDALTAQYGAVAAWRAGIQLLWRIHQAAEVPAAALSERFAADRAHVLVATPAAYEAWGRNFGAYRRVTIVPPGLLAPDHPQVSTSHRIPTVGMLGSWSAAHGQEVLLKAFRLLREGGRRARLRWAGRADTPEAARYRAMVMSGVKASGLSERIIDVGATNDVPGFLASCDLVVIPSLHGSCGRLALEAAALGRPVIASRVEGLAELVKDNVSGLLIPPNDPRALADALELLLASPGLCRELSRQARGRVIRRFTLSPLLDAIERAADSQ